MLVYPSSIDLPSRTLRHLTEQLTVRQREMGTRWRRLPVGRQALLALAHLRCGDIHAQLAAGFGIGIATVYRQYTRAIEVLAALAPTPRNHRRPRGCQAEMLADKASVLPRRRRLRIQPSQRGFSRVEFPHSGRHLASQTPAARATALIPP